MRKELISVSSVTLIAQIAAFAKLWLMARLFGVGPELDGYNLGFFLPTLASGIISGMLQTGLFPVYARLRVQENADRLEQFERLIFLATTGLGALIAIPLALGSPVIAALLARNGTEAVRHWTAFVLPWAAAAILLNAVGDYLGYLLSLRGRFVIAASAPIANAILGASLLAAWPEGGLLNLTAGTIAGLALQVAICFVGAERAGFRPVGRSFVSREFKSELAEMARLGGWIFPGVVFANLTATLPIIAVAHFGEGAVSAFGYAYRIHQNAIQLLVMAASPVVLAHFSDLVARGDLLTMRGILRKAAWASATIGFGGWIAVILLGEPALRLVLGHGRFDVEAASRVATQWEWLTLGLAPAIFGNALARSLQALSRPQLVSLLAGAGLVGFLGLTAGWTDGLSEKVVSIAVTCSSYLVAGIAWWVVVFRSRAVLRSPMAKG